MALEILYPQNSNKKNKKINKSNPTSPLRHEIIEVLQAKLHSRPANAAANKYSSWSIREI